MQWTLPLRGHKLLSQQIGLTCQSRTFTEQTKNKIPTVVGRKDLLFVPPGLFTEDLWRQDVSSRLRAVVIFFFFFGGGGGGAG